MIEEMSIRGGEGEARATPRGGSLPRQKPRKVVRFVEPLRPASAPSSPTFTGTETEADGQQQSAVDGIQEEESSSR